MNSFKQYLVEKKEDKINIIVFSDRHPEEKNGYYPTVKRIVEECKKKKIKCDVEFISEINLILKDNQLIIQNTKENTKKTFVNRDNTVAIIRGSLGNTLKGLSLISTLENYGVFVVNSRRAFEICKNKFSTTSILSANGILCPKSVLVDSIEDLDEALKVIGNKFPVVLKTLEGAEGVGISILDSYSSAKSVLQTMWKLSPHQEFLLQEFLELDGDIRIIVLNKKVVGAMKRIKIANDFRSNRALGASIKEEKITDEQKDIAIKTSEFVDAYYSGVDMAVDKKTGKNYIIEVNTSPGSSGFEEATGINVIGKLIDEVSDKNNWRVNSIESGYVEKIEIKDIGKFDAKLDTGSGIASAIHADNIKVNDDKTKVSFVINGKSFNKPIHRRIRVIKHERSFEESRPVVLFDITINGKELKNIEFGLSSRTGTITKLEPVLLSRDVINKAHLVVNVTKKYMLKENTFKEFLNK